MQKPRERVKVPEEKLNILETRNRSVFEISPNSIIPQEVREWVIYLWLEDDTYFAAAKIKGGLYGQGRSIGKDIIKENKDTLKRRYWLARRNAIASIENTLNVLSMYGSKVIDSHGDIDPKLVQAQERLHSWFSALPKTRKFPIIELTPDEALKMKLR